MDHDKSSLNTQKLCFLTRKAYDTRTSCATRPTEPGQHAVSALHEGLTLGRHTQRTDGTAPPRSVNTYLFPVAAKGGNQHEGVPDSLPTTLFFHTNLSVLVSSTLFLQRINQSTYERLCLHSVLLNEAFCTVPVPSYSRENLPIRLQKSALLQLS